MMRKKDEWMSLEKNVIITSLDVKRHTVCNQRYIKECKMSNHQSTNMFELITLFTMAFKQQMASFRIRRIQMST